MTRSRKGPSTLPWCQKVGDPSSPRGHGDEVVEDVLRDEWNSQCPFLFSP